MQRNAPFVKAAVRKRKKTKSSNHGEKAVAIPKIRDPTLARRMPFRRPILQPNFFVMQCNVRLHIN